MYNVNGLIISSGLYTLVQENKKNAGTWWGHCGLINHFITGKIETQPELTEVETHDLPLFKLSLFFGLVAPLLFS